MTTQTDNLPSRPALGEIPEPEPTADVLAQLLDSAIAETRQAHDALCEQPQYFQARLKASNALDDLRDAYRIVSGRRY